MTSQLLYNNNPSHAVLHTPVMETVPQVVPRVENRVDLFTRIELRRSEHIMYKTTHSSPLSRLAFLSLLCFLTCFLSLPTAIMADVPAPLRLGIFDVDVSPPVGSPLAYDPCESVAMSLRSRGIVLLGDEQPIVLCAVDWIGIANGAHVAWRQAIADAARTSIERVTVHTLHQHDAPFCDFGADAIMAKQGQGGKLFDVKFAQQAIERTAKSVQTCIAQAHEVTHLGLGEAKVAGVASNRRILGDDGKVRATRYTACRDVGLRNEPEGVIDPVLKSISFWNGDQVHAVLTYYATHPQSYYRMGIANPDFPGMARHLREVTLNGISHVHFNGAGGNIGAGKYNDGSPRNRQELAVRMATGMAEAFEQTKRFPIEAREVRWTTTDVLLPAAHHLDDSQLHETLSSREATPLAKKMAASDLAWLQSCQSQHPMTLACLAIGPARVLHLPGEPVVEYQLFAQQVAASEFVAVAGYGDYGPGYICLADHYQQGGYEASPRASRVAPEVETVLKSAIRTLLAP